MLIYWEAWRVLKTCKQFCSCRHVYVLHYITLLLLIFTCKTTFKVIFVIIAVLISEKPNAFFVEMLHIIKTWLVITFKVCNLFEVRNTDVGNHAIEYLFTYFLVKKCFLCLYRVAEIHESYVLKNMQRQTWAEMSYFPGVFRCQCLRWYQTSGLKLNWLELIS